MDLAGKVALITGAGSGIGEAAAKRFAQAGAKVAALGRTEDELQAVVDEIRAGGHDALAVVADIARPDEMRQAIDRIQKEWGRLDVVFANAGINGKWAPLDELELADWDRTIDVNLKGTFLTVKSALPLLKERGGSVIITSSVNGTRIFSNTGATIYSCTKAAQVAFTKMIALELAKHRIRVNVVCPGWIETEIDENTERAASLKAAKEPVNFPSGSVPLTRGKPASPDQVARLVLFLASDEADHITGSEIWIDGGQSLLQG